MTIRKILTEPDPFLRQKSEPVEKVDDSIRKKKYKISKLEKRYQDASFPNYEIIDLKVPVVK